MGSTDSFIPRGDVEVSLNFSLPPPNGEVPFNWVEDPPAGQPKNNLRIDPHNVVIHDIRGIEDTFTLDHDAFQFIRGQPPSKETSFTDDESVKANYYPEVEKLLLDKIPGANRVVIFDHTIRRPPPSQPQPSSSTTTATATSPDANENPVAKPKLASPQREPVYYTHIDQTARSAKMRVHRHIPDQKEAEHLLANTRYRIINVWRTLNTKPVESSPLAYASSASVPQDQIIPVEHRYPRGEYNGETAAIAYGEGQKWYYASGMTGDERVLLECFDSEALKPTEEKDGENGGSRVYGGRVPHSAFKDPRTREDAEGRSSIEVRTLVFGP